MTQAETNTDKFVLPAGPTSMATIDTHALLFCNG